MKTFDIGTPVRIMSALCPGLSEEHGRQYEGRCGVIMEVRPPEGERRFTLYKVRFDPDEILLWFREYQVEMAKEDELENSRTFYGS